MSFLILQTHFLLEVMTRFCQGHIIHSDISIHILIDMAAESIVPIFFDAYFNSSGCSLFSVWNITCCISPAAYRNACGHIWVFAAVCHQTVWCRTSANLRHDYKKKSFNFLCLLRLSFNTTTERMLNFKPLLKPVLIHYTTLSSRSKPHRRVHATTTNMKNRAFLCTDTNSLHSEFLVILQVRIISGSGNNSVQHPFLPPPPQQQLERLPCSFAKDFGTEVCERLHAYQPLPCTTAFLFSFSFIASS